MTLLAGGLGVVRLIDGDETVRLVPEESDRSAGMERTRERGVDGGNGGNGAAFRGGESADRRLLLERTVRTEPATEGEALTGAESR